MKAADLASTDWNREMRWLERELFRKFGKRKMSELSDEEVLQWEYERGKYELLVHGRVEVKRRRRA